MILKKVNFDYKIREMNSLEISGVAYILYELAKKINKVTIEYINEIIFYCDKHLHIESGLLIEDCKGCPKIVDSVFCVDGSSELYFNIRHEDDSRNESEFDVFRLETSFVNL